jgi:PAS domain S-box-containing protein
MLDKLRIYWSRRVEQETGRDETQSQAALFRLSADLAAVLDETEVCQRVVAGLHDTLGHDFVAFFLVEESTGDRVMIACAGFENPPKRLKVGEGISEFVLRDGQLRYTQDVNQESRYFFGMGGSEVDVPVKISGEVGGIIVVESKKTYDFDPVDLEILTAASQFAGLAIEKARLIATERQRADELEALRATMTEITAQLELPVLLRTIVERASVLLEGAGGELGLYDHSGGKVEIVVSYGFRQDYIGTSHDLGEGAMGLVAETGEPLILDDYQMWKGRAKDYEGDQIHAIVAVPLQLGKRLIGVITVVAEDEARRFSIPDVNLLKLFGQQAAIAIENARLFENAQLEIAERDKAEVELRSYQEQLEERVVERTRELQQSEQSYRNLFNGVPVGIYRTTPSGEILDANTGLIHMLGYPSRESMLAEKASSMYIEPENRTYLQAELERDGLIRDVEIQLKRYDGQVIWVTNTARVVKGESGQVLYYEGSMQDISERKQAEFELQKYQEQLEDLVEERTSELRASEERYRTLFDGVPVGLYRSTPEGKVLDFNHAAVEMLGFPNREAVLALDHTSDWYVDPDDQVRWRSTMDLGGAVRDFPVKMRRQDGGVIWVNDSAHVVRDGSGQVLYYEGRLEDITERKNFEKQIRRQKEYFEALFINNPVAVVTADTEGVVVSWNPMAEKLFGYSQEQAVSQELDALVAKHSSVRDEAMGYTNQVLSLDRVQVTTRRTKKDGSLVDVELLALPIFVSDQILGFIAIYYDLSELKKAQNEAEAANQAKSMFLANMSHELRTPLNAILGFTQLMERDRHLTPENQESLKVINHSGEHLLGMINEVLEMSKIEAGQVTLHEKVFDLYDLLYGLEGMFHLRAAEKGLSLQFHWPDDLPRKVHADEGKLRQILSNLLGNAVKFTRTGEVSLRVRFPNHNAKPARLTFEIRDTGPGIAAEDLDLVFEPFVQSSIGQRFREGAGLGLSISRQYVNLMGGEIEVQSEINHGSLFKFDILVELVDVIDQDRDSPHQRVVGLAPGQADVRIVIADDHAPSRSFLVKLLQTTGFLVQEAVDGRQAIQIWEQWEPHLIWMDMRMPGMDGLEVVRYIRGNPGGRDTCIIALTATAFEEDRERIMEAGCDDYLRKPYREEEIFNLLVKHLDVRLTFDGSGKPSAATTRQEAVRPSDLAELPDELIAELKQATTRADMNRMLEVIEKISLIKAELAGLLRDLTLNFEYKQIMALIARSGDEK